MTFRSVVLGLAGAALVCGLSFLNDRVLRQTYLVGNNMPVAVYGILICFVAVVNPLLRRLRLSGRELAVILCLTLAACCVPGAGLLRTFSSSLILPHHFNRLEAGWRQQDVLGLVPDGMLVDVSEDEDTVLDGFVQGLGQGEGHIDVAAVPWGAWVRPCLFWLPIVLSLWAAMIGLSLVVHRQWSRHEHLPYPIATFADALLPPEGGGSRSEVLRSRLFWLGAGVVLFIHLNNYACQWFPEYLIQIPTGLNFWPLSSLFPTLLRGGGGRLLAPRIYFIVIGIAFFIPADVSLAFSLGPFLLALVTGVLAGYGVNLSQVYEGGNWYTGLNPKAFLLFGANLGVFVTVLYTGRHYYASVLRHSLSPVPLGREVGPQAVWGFRVFVLMIALFVFQLCLAGIGLPLAASYAAVLVVFYTVMSRLIAETGLFYIQPMYHACVITWGLYGLRAIGPKMLMTMQLLTMVLTIDPRESLMPFMTNSLKVLDLRSAKLDRAAWLSGGAILIGLAIALPLTLYIQYDQGSAVWEGWADNAVPKMPFANMTVVRQTLEAQGALSVAESAKGTERLLAVSPHPACMWAMAAGLVLFLTFAVARLRLPWWPLHPLIFVTWGTEPIWRMCGAFMIGWCIKVMVTKYGGSQTYNRLKPLMFGLIAGEILGAIAPNIVGAAYYFASGNRPVPFWVLPG